MPDLFETFRARAEAVSAEVHRFESPAAVWDFLAGLLEREGVGEGHGSAVWAAGSLLAPQALPGLGCEVSRETAAGARIGISQVEWGIAATGTLLTDATAAERRLASTLPPIHVAILPTAAILPDMAAAFGRVDPRRSAYLSLITGPSRTADIERVLTIGVHGPKRLVILCVAGIGSN